MTLTFPTLTILDESHVLVEPSTAPFITVEDVEGLVALPVGALIQDIDGDIWEKTDPDTYKLDGNGAGNDALDVNVWLPGIVTNPETLIDEDNAFVIENANNEIGDFEPGDVVRVISPIYSSTIDVGATGKVIEVGIGYRDQYIEVTVDGVGVGDDGEYPWVFEPREIALVERPAKPVQEPQIGDRVRVRDSVYHFAGRQGVIEAVRPGVIFPHGVRLDDNGPGLTYFASFELELDPSEFHVEETPLADWERELLGDFREGDYVEINAPTAWAHRMTGTVTAAAEKGFFPFAVEIDGHGSFLVNADELSLAPKPEPEEDIAELPEDRVSGVEELDALPEGTIILRELSQGAVIWENGTRHRPMPDFALVKVDGNWVRPTDLHATYNISAHRAAENDEIRILFVPTASL